MTYARMRAYRGLQGQGMEHVTSDRKEVTEMNRKRRDTKSRRRDVKNEGHQKRKVRYANHRQIHRDPQQTMEPLVARWFGEINSGERMSVGDIVPMAVVRPNPFTPVLDHAALDEAVAEIKASKISVMLWVARLPNGEYVDVDTPLWHAAAYRAGVEDAMVLVAGEFTTDDCDRIGLVLA